MGSDILSEIIKKRKEDLQKLGHESGCKIPKTRMRKIHPFLQEKGVILEVKRASPSKGEIAVNLDAYETAKIYAESGAKAISCLTESNFFKGSLEDLMAVCRAADDFEMQSGKTAPAVLRKDFLTDLDDVEVSFRSGADAILLIARILDKLQLLSMAKKAEELGLSVLIEVRSDEDLEKLDFVMQNVEHKKILCGVNSRNLADFSIDRLIPAKMYTKIKKIAFDARICFESGILSARSAAFAAGLGFDAILLGEAAAKSPLTASQFISAFEKTSSNENGRFWLKVTELLDSREKICGKNKNLKPLVKICGITNFEDALCAAKCGADFLGFVFCQRSERNVEKKEVLLIKKMLEQALEKSEIKKMPFLVGVIAETESEEAKNAMELVNQKILDLLQVHTYEASKKFFMQKDSENVPHLCAVNLNNIEDICKIDELNVLGEPRILIDSQSVNAFGGNGVQINEKIVEETAKKYKLWLAGGINAENVGNLLDRFEIELLDLSSGVEIKKGIKNHEKIKNFFEKIGEN